jgi:hypothetical protein
MNGRRSVTGRFASVQMTALPPRLVGHAACEADHVHDRFVAGLVRVHARAADRRAKARVVNRDRRAQLGVLVEEGVDFTRTVLRDHVEDAHWAPLLSGCDAPGKEKCP